MNKKNKQNRRVRTLVIGVISFGLIFISLGLPASYAATKAYMEVDNSALGLVTGDVTETGRVDLHSVYEIQHEIDIPVDSNTGMATGTVLHRLFSVTTNVNQGLPLFYQILIAGNSSDITIDYYRESEDEPYYSVKLEDAQIVSIHHNKPNVLNPDNSDYGDMVSLSFNYSKITWTYVVDDGDNIVIQDDWKKLKD